MIEYFVDVAKECINIGNFNSLMAIIGKLFRLSVDDLACSLTSVVNGEMFQYYVCEISGLQQFSIDFCVW